MKKIKIPEELNNYLEKLHYECNGLQELLARISEYKVDMDTALHDYWLKKYLEVYTEYNLVKHELEKTFIIPEFGEVKPWYLDFESGIVTIQ